MDGDVAAPDDTAVSEGIAAASDRDMLRQFRGRGSVAVSSWIWGDQLTEKQDAKLFEEQTRRLLELGGHTSGELQYAHKKVDVLLESYRFGKRRLTAVECKSSGTPLTMTVTARVCAEYQPLLTERKVDEVLLVTRAGLSPSAVTLIRESHGFAHLTLEELSNSVLDLSSYLDGLQAQYESDSDGLSSYYVPLAVSPGGDLMRFTLRWLEHATRPMAVLGAYGSGKTSFALHLAAHLAEIAITDPRARRPLLIRLADVSAEQSLEGLMGRTLGSTAAVPNYSFDRFMALNADRRFVIILDGFDEMKRTLAWEEFRYNLGQLNRLVVPGSRVLLLGRPTAFLNDQEYEYALHGRDKFGETIVRLRDWPDYTTHTLVPFTPAQVETFLDRYLRHAASSQAAQAETTRKGSSRNARSAEAHEKRLDATIRHQIDRVRDGHLEEIAQRPVQLKMLAEILPNWKGSLDRLDTTLLFDSFIDRIIGRDAEKLTRTRFTTAERRAFATALAWWLWTTPNKTRITPDEIPASIVEPFCRPGENQSAVRRDLIAACFLDRSHGGPLVFPHRSFQEFLVAGHALDLLTSGQATIPDIDGALNREVADFMCNMVGDKELQAVDAALAAHRGQLSEMLARLWFSSAERAEWLRLRPRNLTGSPWNVQLLTLAVVRGMLRSDGPDRFEPGELVRLLTPRTEPDYALLVWRCILQIGEATRDVPLIEAALKRLLMIGTQVSALEFEPGDVALPGTHGRYVRPHRSIAQVLHPVAVHERKRTIDLRASYRVLAGRLSDYCWIRHTNAGDGLPRFPLTLKDAELTTTLRQYAAAH